jgi:hypothetical protein
MSVEGAIRSIRSSLVRMDSPGRAMPVRTSITVAPR